MCSSPNTNDLYIWVQSFHTFQNCCNRGGNTIFKYIMFPSLVPQFGSGYFSSKEKKSPSTFVYIMNVQVIGVCDEFLAQGLHLKSHQRCSAGIRTWLSADQSSSSTLTESSFLFDPCLIRDVRIEKGPVQTVAI